MARCDLSQRDSDTNMLTVWGWATGGYVVPPSNSPYYALVYGYYDPNEHALYLWWKHNVQYATSAYIYGPAYASATANYLYTISDYTSNEGNQKWTFTDQHAQWLTNGQLYVQWNSQSHGDGMTVVVSN